MKTMNAFKCFCLICNSPHELALTNQEFRLLVMAVRTPLMDDGRLGIACNACVPFKYSVKGGV